MFLPEEREDTEIRRYNRQTVLSILSVHRFLFSCHLPEEEADARKAVKEIEKAGRKAHSMALSLRESENRKKAVDEHVKVFGKLSVLINNSSMQEICSDLADINLDVVKKTYCTNVPSTFAIFKCTLPHMRHNPSSINSSSVALTIQ